MQKKTLRYLYLPAGSELPAIEQLAPFIAVVLVEEDEISELWQAEVCRWLVASGCRYMLAWGKDCEAWHEAVDDANLEATDYEDIPDDQLVMTTWHEDEDMEEVFWFAKHRASHPGLSLNATVILDIAPAARRDEIEAAYADA